MNKATIQIDYPDGLRGKLVTRPDAEIATDCLKFAEWLESVARDIRAALERERSEL